MHIFVQNLVFKKIFEKQKLTRKIFDFNSDKFCENCFKVRRVAEKLM